MIQINLLKFIAVELLQISFDNLYPEPEFIFLKFEDVNHNGISDTHFGFAQCKNNFCKRNVISASGCRSLANR